MDGKRRVISRIWGRIVRLVTRKSTRYYIIGNTGRDRSAPDPVIEHTEAAVLIPIKDEDLSVAEWGFIGFGAGWRLPSHISWSSNYNPYLLALRVLKINTKKGGNDNAEEPC